MAYHHHASATGSTWRPVTCEHCQGDFAYLMTRTGLGYAKSGVFTSYGDASEGARGGAEVSLEQKMEEFDAVRCPDCGKYQEYMLRTAREQRFKGLKVSGITAGVVAVFMLIGRRLLAYTLVHSGGLSRGTASGIAWLAVGLFAVAAAGMLLYYRTAMEDFDVNADAKAHANADLSLSRGLLRRKDYERALEAASGDERAKLATISWKGAKNVARVAG